MHRQLGMFLANSICIRDPQWNAESGIAMNNHCGMCTELVFLRPKTKEEIYVCKREKSALVVERKEHF